jgi:CheY-like chemotaxis protein
MSKPVASTLDQNVTEFVSFSMPDHTQKGNDNNARIMNTVQNAFEKTKEIFSTLSLNNSSTAERRMESNSPNPGPKMVHFSTQDQKFEKSHHIKRIKNCSGTGVMHNENENEEETEQDTHPILVAEDNKLNIAIIKRLGQNSPYVIDIAENGEEAISKVVQRHYSILFADYMMPGKNGFELSKAVRAMEDPKKRDLPIIVQSDTPNVENIFDGVPIQGFMNKLRKQEEIDHFLSILNLKKRVQLKEKANNEGKAPTKETLNTMGAK